jgi:hypothetical protein
MVKDRGAVAQDNVTKNLSYLVVGEQRTDEKSSKEKIAEKFIESGSGLKIISEKDFAAMVKEADARAASAGPSVEREASEARPATVVADSAPSGAAAFALAPAAVAPSPKAPAAYTAKPAARAPSKPKASELEARPLKDDPEPDRRKEDPMLLALLGGIRARTTSAEPTKSSDESDEDPK